MLGPLLRAQALPRPGTRSREDVMGSASVQGPLWGARAQDWAELTEPVGMPFYEAVFDALGLGPTTHLLDVGCGAGLALQLATKRGATVAGLDAAEGLLDVARRRNPDADLRLGDLEELPFPDGTFTAATSFNAVQYAADPVAALREVRRVLAVGSPLAVLTWGPPERCEMREVLGAIGGLLPPPPPGAGGPFALSAPGALEGLLERAGLRAGTGGDVDTPYVYRDVATAVRAQQASGPAIRAAQYAGDDAVHAALTEVMQRYRRGDGVRLENVFRYVVARA
jgi:SAM-dependent methyltransferase